MIFSRRSAYFLLAVCGLLAASFPGKADNLIEALRSDKHKVVDLSYALSDKLPAWPGKEAASWQMARPAFLDFAHRVR